MRPSMLFTRRWCGNLANQGTRSAIREGMMEEVRSCTHGDRFKTNIRRVHGASAHGDAGAGTELYACRCPLTPNSGISIRLAESVVKVQTLERGMKGNDIETLQRLLGHAGFKVKIDGIFGRLTEAAVIAFQKKSGLDVNGRADPKTIEALTN